MKYFNHCLLLCAFLLFSLLSKAQFDSKRYDKMSFLVGMMDEYVVHKLPYPFEGDSYHQRIGAFKQREDLKNVLFLDSLFNKEYQDIYIRNDNSLEMIMYSPTLSAQIDKYYYSGFYDPSKDTILIRHRILKNGKFEKEKQKLSFMLGVYLSCQGKCEDYMFGFKENDVKTEVRCSYFVLAAPQKTEMTMEILKDLGCEDINYTPHPIGQSVIFKPSKKIQKMIEDAEKLKKYISAINTENVEFTPDGEKYKWIDPDSKYQKTLNEFQ